MQARNLTIRLIRLAMAAALLLPCLLFVYASWVGYRNAMALADERLLRSLDVQREEALKAFQLIDLTLNNASDLVAGMSDDDIRHNEPLLYAEFKKFTSAISIVQSVWIYDKDGYAIVSSSAHPPPTQSYADRDFYQAHFRSDAGTYYGETNISQFNGKPFFTVSRRLNHDGAFAGVVEISVLPSNFFRFYSTLAYTEGLQYGLLRADGVFLARYPAAPPAAAKALGTLTGFHRTIAQNPEGGLYTTVSPIDGIERRFAVRRYGDTPLYLTAGIATATIRGEWIAAMSAHLIFGIPVTLLLFLTLLFGAAQNPAALPGDRPAVDRRGFAPAIAETGSDRPSDRRRGTRLQ
jgi:two-component system NtrC family sensor kinase